MSIIGFLWIFSISIFNFQVFADSDPMNDYEKIDIFNPNLWTVVDDTNGNSEGVLVNPIREGAYKIVHGEKTNKKIDGIIYNDNKINDFDGAQKGTISLIKKWVNYALSVAAFVALLYLLYHGFLMLISAWDEDKYKKWLNGIKTAAIALMGMGLSWMIVSFILYVLNKIV